MEDNNHEMVNMVTQKIGTVINPLIRDTNNSYQTLSTQMERIANFFCAPPTQNVRPVEIPAEGQVNQMPGHVAQQQQLVQPQAQEEPERAPILVNRHQDAD
ncbi:hypothetical protein MTR_1g043730 [Medicago truncatula]|uniref:Uncharacterized protein n=1 Tax=Medicago truncatula TaxID=3880 RepID=G7I5G9_MEDTR|nr:hypothetical protein MTR_1g043730 [Medicago truncatula]